MSEGEYEESIHEIAALEQEIGKHNIYEDGYSAVIEKLDQFERKFKE